MAFSYGYQRKGALRNQKLEDGVGEGGLRVTMKWWDTPPQTFWPGIQATAEGLPLGGDSFGNIKSWMDLI